VVRTGATTKERLYLGAWERFQRSTTTLQEERETLHVMDDQRRIVMIETLTVDSGTPVSTPVPRQRFQLGNHLESAALEVDEDGALITYEEYHPFGSTSWWASNGGTDVSQKRYRYTGKEKDEETGLAYHGARYYAAWLGRWERVDPSGLSGGLNRFEYCKGRPTILSDATGEAPESVMDRRAGISKEHTAQVVATFDARGGFPTPPPALVRTFAAFRLVSGAIETGIGFGAAAETGGLSFSMAFLGADQLNTGVLEMARGTPHESRTTIAAKSVMQSAGASEKTAATWAPAVDLGLHLAAGGATALAQKAAMGRPNPSGGAAAESEVIPALEFDADGLGYTVSQPEQGLTRVAHNRSTFVEGFRDGRRLHVARIQVEEALQGQGVSDALYRRLIEAVGGDIDTITATLGEFNKSEYLGNRAVHPEWTPLQAAEDTPMGRVRTRLGFSEHSFNENTMELTSRRPNGIGGN